MFDQKNPSYGREIYVIYLVFRFLHSMWPKNKYLSGRVEILCDNLTGVGDSSDDQLKTRKKGTLRAIKKNIINLYQRGIKMKIKHTKGHQDNLIYFEDIFRWNQRNVLVDQAAKKILMEFFMQGVELRSSSFHGEG